MTAQDADTAAPPAGITGGGSVAPRRPGGHGAMCGLACRCPGRRGTGEEWHFQMAIWGYVVQGEVIEPDALIAERGDPQFSHMGFWDQTRADLAGAARDRGRGWEPVPDWWALFHLPWSWREQALDEEEEA